MNHYKIVCKLFPASPLVPVKDINGNPMTFQDRAAAEFERHRLSTHSFHIGGGGPYYFVEEVQSST